MGRASLHAFRNVKEKPSPQPSTPDFNWMWLQELYLDHDKKYVVMYEQSTSSMRCVISFSFAHTCRICVQRHTVIRKCTTFFFCFVLCVRHKIKRQQRNERKAIKLINNNRAFGYKTCLRVTFLIILAILLSSLPLPHCSLPFLAREYFSISYLLENWKVIGPPNRFVYFVLVFVYSNKDIFDIKYSAPSLYCPFYCINDLKW